MGKPKWAVGRKEMKRAIALGSSNCLLILTAIAISCLAITSLARPSTGDADYPRGSDASRLAWWREARFGMFIHWGPVSLKGTEIGWSRGAEVPIAEYDQLYKRFNPTLFDADAWALTAKQAGMKYLVITSKHHDGFSLWDTKLSDYNIMNTPFHRDVLKDLAAASRRHGIVFCTYYSILDWYNPDYPLGSPGGKTEKPSPDMDRYVAFLKDQVAELIRNYGPLGIMWFDGEWEKPWDPDRGLDLYNYVRSLQPSIIINNRVGSAREGMAGTTAAGASGGDYDTPEQKIGNFQIDRPWESCITICEQWAWKPHDKMKSLKECLRTLILCAGGDGNLLLNVGPMPDGRIEPRQVERLKEIGAWMNAYGQSIYGTRGGPFKPGTWGASTHKENSIFVHVFECPEGGLVLPPIGKKVISATVLTGGRAEVKQDAQGIRITVPKEARQEIDTLIELKLNGPASDIMPVVVAATGH
jgi:alpha-L-fucosidase